MNENDPFVTEMPAKAKRSKRRRNALHIAILLNFITSKMCTMYDVHT